MNDQRSTAEPPHRSNRRRARVRSVIRAEVRMQVERTGDTSPVERAHTRLRMPSVEFPTVFCPTAKRSF